MANNDANSPCWYRLSVCSFYGLFCLSTVLYFLNMFSVYLLKGVFINCVFHLLTAICMFRSFANAICIAFVYRVLYLLPTYCFCLLFIRSHNVYFVSLLMYHLFHGVTCVTVFINHLLLPFTYESYITIVEFKFSSPRFT